MNKYLLRFNGREKDAIGIFYDIQLIIEANDEKEATIKAYETHEHLHHLSVTKIEEN
jgi:hypothetical protein